MSTVSAGPTTTAELPSPGTVLSGKYVIRQAIGEGGMGKVYLAYQTPFNRRLVVKVMDPRRAEDEVLVQRFMQEAHTISRLTHPNTVTVFDFGRTDDGMFYIVMEYVKGVTLDALVRKTGSLALENAVTFAIQIAQALGEAHHQGIVHRDLKPANIMVVESTGTDPFVKVLDFGIAKMVDENTELTEAGSIVGTPAYMAPEQARGDEVDGRTDLYALGCCLYVMLVGHAPYVGDSVMEVLLSHQNDPVPMLPIEFPEPLRELLRETMAKDPADRPADAATFIARLMGSFVMRGERSTGPGVLDSGGISLSERLRMLGHQTTGDAGRSNDLAFRDTDSAYDTAVGTPAAMQPMAPKPQLGTGSNPSLSGSKPTIENTVTSDPSSMVPEYFDTGEKQEENASEESPEESQKVAGEFAPQDPVEEADVDRPPGDSVVVSPPSGETSEEPEVEVSSPGSTPWVAVWSAAAAAVVVGALVWFVAGADGEGAATLSLESDPSGATVFIDDVPVGTTPLEHETSSSVLGELRFEREGYRTKNLPGVDVEGGAPRVFANLERDELELRITSHHPGVEILLDNTPLGRMQRDQSEKTLTVDWPSDRIRVDVTHPEHGQAYQTFSRGALESSMIIEFQEGDFDGFSG